MYNISFPLISGSSCVSFSPFENFSYILSIAYSRTMLYHKISIEVMCIIKLLCKLWRSHFNSKDKISEAINVTQI